MRAQALAQLIYVILFSVTVTAAASPQTGKPTFRSLSSGFAKFIADSKDKDLDGQIAAWIQDVESQAPEVYVHIIAENDSAKLVANRKSQAQQWFPFLLAHPQDIQQQFQVFETTGHAIINSLAQSYPEADMSKVHVIGLPSLMHFNGQVVTINGEIYAMFGMDMVAFINTNPQMKPGLYLLNDLPVLMAHEFTHAINNVLSDFGGSDPSTDSFWAPLWAEGLAEVNSQMLNAGTSLDQVYMERNLAQGCNANNIGKWAKEYLADAKGTEAQIEQSYSKWFTISGAIPNIGVYRGGYCLGYSVILTALRSYSMEQIIRMNRAQAYKIGQDTLAELSAAK